MRYKIIFKEETLFDLEHSIEQDIWIIRTFLSRDFDIISEEGAKQILERLAWIKID